MCTFVTSYTEYNIGTLCFLLASMQDKANADKKKKRPRSSINMNQLK